MRHKIQRGIKVSGIKGELKVSGTFSDDIGGHHHTYLFAAIMSARDCCWGIHYSLLVFRLTSCSKIWVAGNFRNQTMKKSLQKNTYIQLVRDITELDPKFPNLFLADPLPMKRYCSMLQN